MAGTRPFTETEIPLLLGALGQGRHGVRNRALFALALRSGGRARQVLGLKIRDVWTDEAFVPEVRFARKLMKGKRRGHAVPLHKEAKAHLEPWLGRLRERAGGKLHPNAWLFPSQKGRLSFQRYWSILRTTCAKLGFPPGTATHSARKTFARRIYRKSGHCLIQTGRWLGHRAADGTIEVKTTARYLDFENDEASRALVLES